MSFINTLRRFRVVFGPIGLVYTGSFGHHTFIPLVPSAKLGPGCEGCLASGVRIWYLAAEPGFTETLCFRCTKSVVKHRLRHHFGKAQPVQDPWTVEDPWL